MGTIYDIGLGAALCWCVLVSVPRHFALYFINNYRCTGQQETSDATLETLKAIEHNVSKQAQILVEICSYAGTSNVLKVQAMLHHCNDHIEKKEGSKEDDAFQAFAVIGIALVAMGEDVGAEMALRQFNHLVSVPRFVAKSHAPLIST